MFVDPSGHDAVYITRYGQDDGGLPVAGHSSVLLQAEDGLWYHVEFAGSNKDNASVRIDSTIKYDENGFTRVPKGFSSPDAFFEEKNWQSAYMHTYIEGDFTESYKYAQYLREVNPRYARDGYEGYNLLFNNCHHFVQNILLKGKFKSFEIANYFMLTITSLPLDFHIALIARDVRRGMLESANEFMYDAFVEPIQPFVSWLKSWIL